MNADFFDAHNRHWQDWEQLFASERWANADHLYGMAAECGLKCLMQAFPPMDGMWANMLPSWGVFGCRR
uniref:Uncharacterized protein n=1 Tax=Candidatus Kentrum sp. TUN TaxID=2126343 RepID=A0A451A340_9GAMM|nr:MAG: hypothetical protein BECKTUN1418F_GA0071002_105616 [Candidatus Kentron sp. TUN]VFK55380.1 MAG: hypothetical protein BECKTUN1418D_GA0071000_103118 [Candidatus Kentron sp. TUN]VFK60455.1 MAG: hypothetical protein BECKTUN1418E_GA0071001_105815 [Candidatus Kentron sp. TUN]